MTLLPSIALLTWIGVLPALVVSLRLRRAAAFEAVAATPPAPPPRRPIGNLADACERARHRHVACLATHVEPRRAQYRIGHASRGSAKRH
jgi:hypothetical protein